MYITVVLNVKGSLRTTGNSHNREVVALYMQVVTIPLLYCIAGKFGGELNFAVWRYAFQPPN